MPGKGEIICRYATWNEAHHKELDSRERDACCAGPHRTVDGEEHDLSETRTPLVLALFKHRPLGTRVEERDS